ncbi:MAG TPA: hypothetical protein DCZ11_08830 [Gammaproteobacteria bacterium]|nr:hypothetical protein [Gammaproteobacteria bacterium]MCH78533.1 hypothetical protein [Gammaproteobacteria bacterium]
MDLSGLLNPKRVIKRREDESEAEFRRRAAKGTVLEQEAAPDDSGVRFGKGFTDAERQEQRRKLAEKLRERDKKPAS